MKKYPKYKNSFVPWLGNIPEHWETIKIKYIFKERVEKGHPDEPLLAATQTKGVVPKSMYENRTVEAQKDLHLLKLVKSGDFVISLRSFQGGIEYAYFRGIISPAYTVMIPYNKILPGFYKHLAKSKAFISLLKTCVTGIREGQNINYDILRRTPIPVPHIDEQTQIASYLDWQSSKINKFIKAKKKLISLLKEQKQNIINEAVTKGINPDVKMKDSGVEWLGEIPEHWEVRRLKNIGKVVLGKMLKTSPSKGDLLKPYLRSINVQWMNIKCDNIYSMWFSKAELEQYKLKNQDIVVCEGGEVGRACLWNEELEECYIQNAVHKISVYPKMIPKFLLYQFVMLNSKAVFISIVNRVSIAHLTREKLVVVSFVVPCVEEQQAIVDCIEKETAFIDQIICRAEREVELIQEYRTRLVSDVVTGKVDVRAIDIPDFEPVEADLETQDEKESEDELVVEELEE